MIITEKTSNREVGGGLTSRRPAMMSIDDLKDLISRSEVARRIVDA
jgi:hypothetical protein